MMDIVIVVRQTENYEKLAKMNLEDIKFNHGVITQNRDRFVNYIKGWNKICKMNYFTYRARLKEISFKSLQNTNIPVISWTKDIVENNKHNKNMLIIPTDDDDWLHPYIRDYLEDYCKSNFLVKNFIIWKNILCNSWGHSGNYGNIVEYYHDVASNSYAVKLNENSHITYVACHGKIKRRDCSIINEPLSVWVRHPASICKILQSVKLPPEMFKLKKIPKDLIWAERYINMLEQLRKDLNNSIRDVKLL